MRSLVAVFDLKRRLSAEALGTGFLVAAVVGSGIMAAKLAEETVQSHSFATRFPPVPFFL